MAVEHRVSREAFAPEVTPSIYRYFALLGLVIASVASYEILYDITVVLGGSNALLMRIGLAIAGAWLVARYLAPRIAIAIFVVTVVISYIGYLFAVGGDLRMLIEAPVYILAHTVNDAVTIVTGQSVLTISATDVWALSFAPAPIFITWYFAFARRYAVAAAFAGAIMFLFVLSGDLGWWWTLVGTIGVAMTVAFGEFERRRASPTHVEWFVLVIVAMAGIAMLVPVVPGGGLSGPVTFVDDSDIGDEVSSLESSVVGSGSELEIVGEFELSPDVRFTIESTQDAHWRTGVYDRYTGSGWVRTGGSSSYGGPQFGPESGETILQQIRIESPTDRIPVASRPTSAAGISDLRVTDHGSFESGETLSEGETLQVVSTLPEDVSEAGNGEVPDGIQDRYTQLPEDMPDRVGELTEHVVSDAEDPVLKAQRIEAYLKEEKAYSLEVERPSGDVADAFLFEMEAGYCTYFATAMVAMLRSEDIPARMAVGYAQGQEVAENRWVVRGLNSHAWVEMYVADVGWVTFDPTPAGPRLDARNDRVEQARDEDFPEVDTDESAGLPFDHDPRAGDDVDNDSVTNETDAQAGEQEDIIDPEPGEIPDELEGLGPTFEEEDDVDESLLASLPPYELLFILFAITIGAIVSIKRSGVVGHTKTEIRHRWHLKRNGGREDIDRSLDRLEWALARTYRPRRPTETHRRYRRKFGLSHDDDRVDRLYDIVEAARYGGDISESRAAMAVELADQIVSDTVVFGGRLLPSKTAE